MLETLSSINIEPISDFIIEDPSELATVSLDNSSLEPFISPTITCQLTSLMHNALTSIQCLPSLTALMALSAMPKHPYERVKYKLYGPNYKDVVFKTIDEISLPTNLQPQEMLGAVMNVGKKIQTALAHNLSCEPHLRCDTLLNTVSCDQIIPNVEKQKQQIEFIEIVKSMQLESASEEQLRNYALKIVGQFIKMY